MFAGIKWLDFKDAYDGKDRIEIHYGIKRDKLRYVMKHEGVLSIKLRYKGEADAEFNIECSHRSVEHIRL